MKKARGVPIDLSGKYRRQIYLATFPLGALVSAGYLWVSASKASPANLVIAVGVSVLLTVLFVGVLLRPSFLNTAESIFYFSMSFYFVIYSHSNVNLLPQIKLLTEERLNDVIAGMGMWLVIMLIGAFLSISPRQFRILIVVNSVIVLIVASINLRLLYQADMYSYGYLYRWLNVIFALIIAILLTLRIGLLQQQYASTDALTGLLNRRAMYDVLSREMHRTDRYNKPFSILLFDLDRFKSVNDRYGHDAGDHALKEIAEIVRKQIRDIDSFSRWGGEEFLVLLLETDHQRGMQAAERIRRAIDEYPFSCAGHLTGSFGVITYTSGQSLDELLRDVDQGMYTAKNNGGNRVSLPAAEIEVENP